MNTHYFTSKEQTSFFTYFVFQREERVLTHSSFRRSISKQVFIFHQFRARERRKGACAYVLVISLIHQQASASLSSVWPSKERRKSAHSSSRWPISRQVSASLLLSLAVCRRSRWVCVTRRRYRSASCTRPVHTQLLRCHGRTRPTAIRVKDAHRIVIHLTRYYLAWPRPIQVIRSRHV